MKALLVVIAAAALAVAATVWLTAFGPEEETMPALFPELTFELLGDVDRVEIGTEETSPTLSIYRDTGTWRVAEHYDYPADVLKIRRLLTDLNDARRVEQKTSSPEYYARLGVADPGSDGGGGLLTVRSARHGAWQLIVGDSSQQLSDGQYVRRAGEETSWLIDVQLQIPMDPADWLDTRIVHIEPGEITSMTLRHPEDDTPVTIVREADGKFGLSGLPKGKVIDNQFMPRQIAATTDYLQFREVFPREDSGIELPEEYIDMRITASTRTVVTLKAYRNDDGVYLTLDPVDAAGAGSAPGLRLSGWLYEVSPTVYDDLNKRYTDLVKDAPG